MDSCRINFLFSILLLLPYLSLQQRCSTKINCDECIKTFGCIWCSDPNFEGYRCQREQETRCSLEFVKNTKLEATIVEALDLTEVRSKTRSHSKEHNNDNQENVVQISPQKISLKLRPNENHPLKFDVYYRQAEDYPVDLYYLMDLSNSMNDDKDKLSTLGQFLSETMSNITSKFHLGFGSFVDKVAMPFVNMAPKHLQSPCQSCAPPYGFRNVMPLSQDTSQFETQVKSANVSGNLDAPEGGFDAIMQAVVCKDQIGWRDKARKLLVFSTDSSFHYAGDGKLAGIVKPNDGCCHLDKDRYYSYSTVQDYPSVSQISYKIKEHSINLIFAVTQEQVPLYEQLAKYIEGSFCGQLSNDSSNIVELVREQYNKITSSVEMREENLKSHFRVKYYSRCLDEDGPLVETNKCDGLKEGKTVKFEVHVELLSCPANQKDWKQSFTISPARMDEKTTVEVEMLCDCDCSSSENVVLNSSKCSYHGLLKCGICECDPGFFGDDCNCTGEEDKTDNCKASNSSALCSDRGICKCNKCHCSSLSDFEQFWGNFCECDNFTCSRTGGKLCAGHGSCVCGRCKCDEGWMDDGCTCENSTSNCIGLNDEICSGNGVCQCNKCICNKNGDFWGKVCDKCPTCSTKCNELKGCVECKVHNSGPLSKQECDKCDIIIDVVENYQVIADQENFCSHRDDRDCRFTYYYAVNGKKFKVTAIDRKECPPQAYIPGIIFSVILGIVLIGLACLMIWKIFTSMRDRREYAKFEKERMMAKWDTGQNPIYIQATSTFRNPLYNGN